MADSQQHNKATQDKRFFGWDVAAHRLNRLDATVKAAVKNGYLALVPPDAWWTDDMDAIPSPEHPFLFPIPVIIADLNGCLHFHLVHCNLARWCNDDLALFRDKILPYLTDYLLLRRCGLPAVKALDCIYAEVYAEVSPEYTPSSSAYKANVRLGLVKMLSDLTDSQTPIETVSEAEIRSRVKHMSLSARTRTFKILNASSKERAHAVRSRMGELTRQPHEPRENLEPKHNLTRSRLRATALDVHEQWQIVYPLGQMDAECVVCVPPYTDDSFVTEGKRAGSLVIPALLHDKIGRISCHVVRLPIADRNPNLRGKSFAHIHFIGAATFAGVLGTWHSHAPLDSLDLKLPDGHAFRDAAYLAATRDVRNELLKRHSEKIQTLPEPVSCAIHTLAESATANLDVLAPVPAQMLERVVLLHAQRYERLPRALLTANPEDRAAYYARCRQKPCLAPKRRIDQTLTAQTVLRLR